MKESLLQTHISSCPELIVTCTCTCKCLAAQRHVPLHLERLSRDPSDLYTPPAEPEIVHWPERSFGRAICQPSEPPMQCCNAPRFLPGWVESKGI